MPRPLDQYIVGYHVGDDGCQGNWQAGYGGRSYRDPGHHQRRGDRMHRFDRDDGEWRQHRLQRFSDEFNDWRSNRDRNRAGGEPSRRGPPPPTYTGDGSASRA